MSERPDEIKREIIEESGTVIPEGTVVYDAASGRLEIEGLEPPVEPKPDPGDDDPSRIIDSAEVGMTFRVDPDDHSLDTYIAERFTEIRQRPATEDLAQ